MPPRREPARPRPRPRSGGGAARAEERARPETGRGGPGGTCCFSGSSSSSSSIFCFRSLENHSWKRPHRRPLPSAGRLAPGPSVSSGRPQTGAEGGEGLSSLHGQRLTDAACRRQCVAARAGPPGKGPEPTPPPVSPSAAALRARRTGTATHGGGKLERERPEAAGGGTLGWGIQELDKALDKVEEKPPPFAKELYGVIESKEGKAIGKAFQELTIGGAKVSVKAGKEAVKRGAPILGKGAGWVAKKGFEAVVNRGKKRGR